MPEPTRTGASFSRHRSKQDYSTPREFVRAVERRFGFIAWDLAASADNRVCERFIGEDEDSLTVAWHKRPGLLWLNPPFGNIAPWAEKCATECAQGARILLLVPASTGAQWFQRHVFGHASVLFLAGRLSFDGKAPFPKDCALAAYDRGFPPAVDCWDWRVQE